MNGLLGSSALPWDKPAAGHEGQPALGTSTLGRLGSSYLDADCILDNCPSRDTFLLPDDADEPPAPLSRQHIVSTTSANLPPNTSSQPPPAGMQLAGAHAGGDMLSSGACRVPARLSTHLSTAGAGMRRTAGVSPHTVTSSSGAWEKPGAAMLLSSAHAANSSSRPGAQSPLVSARTVAALMAGEDDLQQADLDLLGMDGALLPLEGDLLWGAGAQALPDSTPPAVPGAGAQAQYGAAPPAPGTRSLVVGQQYQQSHQAHQQALQQQQQQLRLLGTASPIGLGQLGSRKGPAGSPATGYGSPAAQSRPHAPLVDAYHPQYQQYQQQQAAYSQRQPHLQQQQQPWQDGRAAAWQQHHQQLQHAYLAQRQQQQLGAHPGHGSSSRPVARVLHPVGLQPGRTLHAGGIQQHTQQLQQQTSAHQHMHQQQQVHAHAQTQVHGMQQQQPTQQGCMSSPAGWQSTAAAASAGNQGPVELINGFPAAAAVVQPTVAGSNAAVAAALCTWGSNTSSMTAAADAAGSPGGTTTTAAAGGGGGVRSSEAPTDSSAPAATAVSLAAGSSNEQQRQVVARSILASAGSGTQQFQAATLAALENCFPAPPAGTGVVQGQETKEEQQQLQQLLALAQGSNGAAATAPQDASSLAAAATATATGVGAPAPPPPPPAAAAAAEATASAPAGTLAAAANAAASPLKGPNSGAGGVSLSSANSGSMGDSSHDSSQTQQQDAGSAELPAAAATDLSAPVAAACAVAPAATAAAADAAAGAADAAAAAAPVAGEEGAAGPTQPRVFHHKGGGPCDHCGVMESPQWRRGPPAKPILCNACGTRYRRTHHLGPPIPSGGRVGGPRPPAAGSSGGSSGGGSTPGRKRAAAAEALGPAPLPVNFEGGVHTGTRRARNPNRPAPKQYRIEDV